MSARAPSFDFRHIDTPAGQLPCIVRGPVSGAQILIIPPLFEEMNRTRALLAAVGRELAHRGIASWLPDLPGTGDSDASLRGTAWPQWQDAVAAMIRHIGATTGTNPHIFSVRGGALLDDAASASGRYRLAPVPAGERLLRELLRARLAAEQERGTPTTMAALEAQLAAEPVELAGYVIAPALAADLRAARLSEGPDVRTAQLVERGGDIAFDGPLLWRQAEPRAAPALAAAIAHDLAEWMAT